MAISTVRIYDGSDDGSVMTEVTEFTINWVDFRTHLSGNQ